MWRHIKDISSGLIGSSSPSPRWPCPPRLLVPGFLFWGPWSLRRSLFRHDALSADGARVVFPQPRRPALLVEPMAAREAHDLMAYRDFVHANAALGFAGIVKHAHVDVPPRKRHDGVVGGWTRRVTPRVLLHHL